jgi:hypothetical protein
MLKEVSAVNLNYEATDQWVSKQLNEPPKEAVRLAILMIGTSMVSRSVSESCIR